MGSFLIFAEKAFNVLTLLLFSEGLYPHLRRGSSGFTGESTDGDPVMQIVWFGIYTIALPLLIFRWRQFFSIALKEKLILLLVGFTLASVLWSDVPDITSRRTIALLGTTLFGAYFGTRYTLSQQLRLLGTMIFLAAILSVFFAIALPSYGTMSGVHTGAWQGIFGQKNILGRFMTLGVIVFLLMEPKSKKNRLVVQASVGLTFCLIVLSGAKTALIIFLFLIALLCFYKILRWKYTLAIPSIIFVVLIVGGASTWLITNLETVLASMGRDMTLSGRTVMWSAVVNMILQRPWLGYGYSGFWLGLKSVGSAYVWNLSGWEPKFAHNGYLDLSLNLGLIGLLIFTLGFVASSLRAINWLRSTKNSEGFWPIMYFSFMFLYNLTESAILKQNSIFWALYVSTTFAMFFEHHRLKKERMTKQNNKSLKSCKVSEVAVKNA